MSTTYAVSGHSADKSQASLAVDGNANLTKWPPPWSCCFTSYGRSSFQWYHVDLGSYFEITEVALTPRNDSAETYLGKTDLYCQQ